jgi:hypothetical protein
MGSVAEDEAGEQMSKQEEQKVERFDPEMANYYYGGQYATMEGNDLGDYVTFSAYQEMIQQKDAQLAAERAAHEVTKKALKLAITHWNNSSGAIRASHFKIETMVNRLLDEAAKAGQR